LARYKKSGRAKFENELDEAGFTEDEKTLVLLKIEALSMYAEMKNKSGEEEVRAIICCLFV
jgi:hypothetical protein